MKENDTILMNYGTNEIPVTDATEGVNVSIDAGSSETRTHIWAGNPKAGTITGISSGYSIMNNDISLVQAQSDNLYDNLEIRMRDLTAEKVDKVFDDITIVKGGLLEDLRQPVTRTSSNIGKALQDTTYINAIANIGIRLYMMAYTVGSCKTNYIAKVTLALPNEDVSSAKRQDEVKNKLAGDYEFELPRCKFKVNIKIYRDSILLVDEAQAALGSWRIQNKGTDNNQYNNVLIIDAGGRSVDLSIMIKNRILQRGSLTGKFGGQKFIDLIMERYVNETGENMPSRDMVTDALDMGLLQDGNSTIDITTYIAKAKEEITPSICNDINSLLDSNDLRLNQFNLVLCAGRFMGETAGPNGHTVASLATYIEKYVKRVSPNTYVGRLKDQYALVRGLSLARFAYEAKMAKK